MAVPISRQSVKCWDPIEVISQPACWCTPSSAPQRGIVDGDGINEGEGRARERKQRIRSELKRDVLISSFHTCVHLFMIDAEMCIGRTNDVIFLQEKTIDWFNLFAEELLAGTRRVKRRRAHLSLLKDRMSEVFFNHGSSERKKIS